MWDVVTFVFPCFSGGCFIVTKMALGESGYLDQVDVRVEKVNEAPGYRRVLAVTCQWCPNPLKEKRLVCRHC